MTRPTLHTERLRLEPAEARHVAAYRAFYVISNDLAGSYRAPRPEGKAA